MKLGDANYLEPKPKILRYLGLRSQPVANAISALYGSGFDKVLL